MPETIEAKKAKRRREAVQGVMLFALLQVASAICLGAVCLVPDIPQWALVLCLALAILCLVLILPAVWILKERFREIEGGELDAADQY